MHINVYSLMLIKIVELLLINYLFSGFIFYTYCFISNLCYTSYYFNINKQDMTKASWSILFIITIAVQLDIMYAILSPALFIIYLFVSGSFHGILNTQLPLIRGAYIPRLDINIAYDGNNGSHINFFMLSMLLCLYWPIYVIFSSICLIIIKE